MSAESKARQLLVAVADAAPAFVAPARPSEGGFGRKLLIALSDTTPAFGQATVVPHREQGEIPGLIQRLWVDSSASRWSWATRIGRAIEDMSSRLKDFTPEQIDMDRARADIEALSRRLAISGEVDISLLDSFIDAMVVQWVASVHAQHAAYAANVSYIESESRGLFSDNQLHLQGIHEQLDKANKALKLAERRGARRRARRSYRKTSEVIELSRIHTSLIGAITTHCRAQLQAADQIAGLEANVRVAQGDQLKQLARLEIAARLQDRPASDISSS